MQRRRRVEDEDVEDHGGRATRRDRCSVTSERGVGERVESRKDERGVRRRDASDVSAGARRRGGGARGSNPHPSA